jgi:hypothetical protein
LSQAPVLFPFIIFGIGSYILPRLAWTTVLLCIFPR